jgi:phosphate transport system substrate-binding protein
VPSLRDWVDFFLSDAMAGPNGALQSVGLVSDPTLADTRAAFTAGTTIGQ